MKNMYRPLPDSLSIKQSGINGVGLFAQEDLAQGTNLGMSHLELGKLIIRTPLGGFVNHSNTPNCIKVYLDHLYLFGRFILLRWNFRKSMIELSINI